MSMDNGKVRFRWKDYRDGHRQKTMPLEVGEFIRRFLIHVLPDGFHRTHYYGFLGDHHRVHKLALCRNLILPITSRVDLSFTGEPRRWGSPRNAD
ncbi:MAG: transposase [Rhodopila sp.]